MAQSRPFSAAALHALFLPDIGAVRAVPVAAIFALKFVNELVVIVARNVLPSQDSLAVLVSMAHK